MNPVLLVVRVIFLVVLGVGWALVGTLFWIAVLFRTLTVYTAAFFAAMFTEQQPPDIHDNLERVTDLWFRGFRNAYTCVFGGSPQTQSTRPEKRTAQLIIESAYTIIFWIVFCVCLFFHPLQRAWGWTTGSYERLRVAALTSSSEPSATDSPVATPSPELQNRTDPLPASPPPRPVTPPPTSPPPLPPEKATPAPLKPPSTPLAKLEPERSTPSPPPSTPIAATQLSIGKPTASSTPKKAPLDDIPPPTLKTIRVTGSNNVIRVQHSGKHVEWDETLIKYSNGQYVIDIPTPGSARLIVTGTGNSFVEDCDTAIDEARSELGRFNFVSTDKRQ